MLKIFIISFIAIFFGFALTACNNTNTTQENPYAAEIARAYENANSEYVRDILRDGQITSVEMRDAEGKMTACLADAGIEASYEDNGYGYRDLVIVDSDSEDLIIENECHKKWIGEIGAIYTSQIANPQNGDFEALISACLVREGLVDETFTGSDYREFIRQNGKFFSFSGDDLEEGTIEQITGEPTEEIFLPSGVSMRDPRVVTCEINPSR